MTRKYDTQLEVESVSENEGKREKWKETETVLCL